MGDGRPEIGERWVTRTGPVQLCAVTGFEREGRVIVYSINSRSVTLHLDRFLAAYCYLPPFVGEQFLDPVRHDLFYVLQEHDLWVGGFSVTSGGIRWTGFEEFFIRYGRTQNDLERRPAQTMLDSAQRELDRWLPSILGRIPQEITMDLEQRYSAQGRRLGMSMGTRVPYVQGTATLPIQMFVPQSKEPVRTLFERLLEE